MKEFYDKAKGTNYDSKKNPFLDSFVEPDSNKILHTCESKTPAVYRNVEWMAELRGDRRERVVLRKKLKARLGSPKG